MKPLRAQVRDGRIVVDEPTDLPNGTVLSLVPDDEGDNLDEQEREDLHRAIALGWAQFEAGQGRSAEEVIADLRRR